MDVNVDVDVDGNERPEMNDIQMMAAAEKKAIAAEPEEKLKYPRSVVFIISNEFCERFNYYGMRTILVLYLTLKLGYNEETATVQFHVFTMLVYIFPLIGALLADTYIGKYKTILYLSIIYSIGAVVIAVGAIPLAYMPTKAATQIGLLLIAIGTGGIKPCVSAFGGDQFILPSQAQHLQRFFSLFYFAINAGSMISTTVTPILRSDIQCFGDYDCFPLAFGLPAILMLISVLIFICGRPLYKRRPPSGNMIFGVVQCIGAAFTGWREKRHTQSKKHFLDYAAERSSRRMIYETKCLVKILILFLPFPVFWALFDQQGSRWTFQATRMENIAYGYNIKPDQMQVINPLLILAFIPLFDYIIYPMLKRVGIKRPLQKLSIGGLLAAAAFLISAQVEHVIETPMPESHPTHQNVAHLRLYNGMNCPYDFTIDDIGLSGRVESLDMWLDLDIRMDEDGSRTYAFRASPSTETTGCTDFETKIQLAGGQSSGFFMARSQIFEFSDGLNFTANVNAPPLLRLLINTPLLDGVMELNITRPLDSDNDDDDGDRKSTNNKILADQLDISKMYAITGGLADFNIGGNSVFSFESERGGLYVLLLNGNKISGYNSNLLQVVEPRAVPVLWQLPQIIVITAAEIMFSVTGLEFSYSQAPASMKSVVQACWLLSVAIGNMIVVLIAEIKVFPKQSQEFTLFGFIMIFDMLLFMLLTRNYTYVQQEGLKSGDNADEQKQIRHQLRAVRKKGGCDVLQPPDCGDPPSKCTSLNVSGFYHNHGFDNNSESI